MTSNELLKIKENLEQATIQAAALEGELKGLLEQLKEFGCSDRAGAENKLEELERLINEVNEELRASIEEYGL